MALATQCPHCATTFRVASDQLKLRGGIVRCGACQEIFDGNASLLDLDALAVQAVAATGIEAKAVQDTIAPGDVEDEDDPIYTLDLDATFDPLGILPKPETADHDEAAQAGREPEVRAEPASHPEPEPHPGPEVHAGPEARASEEPKPVFSMGSALLEEPEPFDAPATAAAPDEQVHAPHAAAQDDGAGPLPDLPVDEELVASPLPADDHEDHETDLHAQADELIRAAQHLPLPMRESADSGVAASPGAGKPARSKLAARRSKLTPTRIAPPKLRVPEIDEPEFVKRGRQREQFGKRRTILMAAGSAVLVALLAAQAVTNFRNVLAARYPAARPALASACSVLGCRVELPAQIDNLGIETGELQTLGANTYLLTTLLHNQGSLVQAWPSIELTLTDTNDKPVLRRVFTPAEYLPRGVAPTAGFAPRAEHPVKLYFQLDQLKPSGYRIAIFYP